MPGARAAAWNGGGGGSGGGRRALTLALVMGALAILLVQPAEGARSLRSNKASKHKADAGAGPREQREGKCLGMGTCLRLCDALEWDMR